jgi:hypothetical protein
MCARRPRPPRSAFLRVAADEDAMAASPLGWFRLQMTANAHHADAVLPLALVLFMNAAVALLPWWTAIAVLPGGIIAFGALQYAAGLATGVRNMRPRTSVLVVASLLVAGACVFVTTLAPDLLPLFPGLVVAEAAMFALNALVFWKTVFTDAGTVPLGNALSGVVAPGARVCATCKSVRPLRSKHDPFLGRCVRCVPHACGRARARVCTHA